MRGFVVHGLTRRQLELSVANELDWQEGLRLGVLQQNLLHIVNGAQGILKGDE